MLSPRRTVDDMAICGDHPAWPVGRDGSQHP
jgi:hypothetical protein